MASLAADAVPGTRARYLVLTAQHQTPPPFGAVDFVWGPRQKAGKHDGYWWQLEVRSETAQSATPLFVLRGLTAVVPLASAAAQSGPVPRTEPSRAMTGPPARQTQPSPGFFRYLLRIPDLGETLEYRDCHSGRALLPGWQDFERLFLPRPAQASRAQGGAPETCEYLGQVLTLTDVRQAEPWQDWEAVEVLDLDRELLVGTGRNFKDKEGRRLPKKSPAQDYTYIPFEEPDYRVMIEAGINLFTVAPGQEKWVRTQPVFYLRGAGGNPPLRYPADLYRANYLGPVMFMDEPSILMVGDKQVHNTLRFFSDAAALIEKRTRVTYLSAGSYGAFALEKALLAQGVNLGDMRLMQPDYPSWETLYDTAFYQMKGGGMGIVHEGRYQLADFDAAVEWFTGQKRKHTARELLQYHYAFLRGGARPFGKFWGTAIYGQCDPAIAPEAVTLAYDMGARYVWFWTSDHDHHVPWPEQLALASALRQHAAAHPRPSLHASPPEVDVAIVVPNGCFLSLENLWWVRVLDKEGKNDASQRYRRLMQRALQAVHECFDARRSFDVTVDDGRKITGYRRVVRLRDD